MAILVDLKHITSTIYFFISNNSFPENSPIFATAARSIIQNTLALVQFLSKHSPTSRAESLKQLIMNLVSASKVCPFPSFSLPLPSFLFLLSSSFLSPFLPLLSSLFPLILFSPLLLPLPYLLTLPLPFLPNPYAASFPLSTSLRLVFFS